MKADRNWYLDSEGKATDDARRAATLLIRKGMEVPPHMAKRHGIGARTETQMPSPSEDKMERPAPELKTEPAEPKKKAPRRAAKKKV